MKIKIELAENEKQNPILLADAIIDYFGLYDFDMDSKSYRDCWYGFATTLACLNAFAEVNKPVSWRTDDE